MLELEATRKINHFDSNYLSKGAILDDFEASVDVSDTQIINDIKLFSIKEVNNEYAKKLESLSSAISLLDDEEVRGGLISVLNDINIAKQSKLASQLSNLVESNQSSIVEILDNASEVAAGIDEKVDYLSLRAVLISLREHFVSADIYTLLKEIGIISNSSMEAVDKYSELVRVIGELNKLLDAGGEAVYGNYASIVKSINGTIDNVQNKITAKDNTVDSTIISDIADLYAEANSAYIEHLKVILTELQDELDLISDGYTSAVEALRDSDDEAIAAILDSLDDYNGLRTEQLSDIENFCSDDNSSIVEEYMTIPYGVLAVLYAWPAYMKRSYITGVQSLYRDVRKVINGQSTSNSLVFDQCFYDNSEKVRLILTSTANTSAFQQLFDRAKDQEEIASQENARTNLINTLGSLILPPNKLSEAIDAIICDNDTYASRNAVLSKLVGEWHSSASVSEKQRILEEMCSELDNSISIDSQLKEISAKLLCPSILLFDESQYDGEFYSSLRAFIETNKKAFLACTTYSDISTLLTSAGSAIESDYELLSSLLKALKQDDILLFDDLSADLAFNLLSTEQVNTIRDIAEYKEAVDSVDIITSCKLISMLTDRELVVAWQDDTNNWVDSSGNYYQKFTNYKNTSKPAEWVAYPINGTADEQRTWLAATEEWVALKSSNETRTLSLSDSDGHWRTSSGAKVAVSAKRSYRTYDSDACGWVVSEMWLDSDDEEIIVNSNSGWLLADGEFYVAADSEINNVMSDLFTKVSALGKLNYLSDDAKAAHSVLLLETQLLNSIRELDKNRDFYYSVPIESNIAIDFNDGDSRLNTLMNPMVNYDINNVNNNFVISKIDINYLTSGLQIARSSKLN